MNEQAMWQAKVLAFLHDPAEKALILLRGKGHEVGTVAAMEGLLGEDLAQAGDEVARLKEVVKTADRWASAADRPSLPMKIRGNAVFANDPQLIHPLTGQTFRLLDLAGDQDAKVEAIEAVSFDHFRALLVRDEQGRVDWRRSFLKLWRFGPVTPAPGLGALWGVLPADTRSPDHSIWEHLNLTSAFAGAIAADGGGPALLLMSFGPVQGFIAQARSVSDLWAGSHLLSRIAWEAMRTVCGRFGPDAVLFPDLHGVAVADLWLQQELGEWPAGKPRPWAEVEDDRNPLFAAALPNRFVALVPANETEGLARRIVDRVRTWARAEAKSALAELLSAANRDGDAVAEGQLDRQFRDFPEVHWAAVPWTLAGGVSLGDDPLKDLLSRLGANQDYLNPTLEGLLRGEITVEGHSFFTPNPGTAYPGLYEALERLHTAAKAARPFGGESETGYRCTLCGEREWLTDDEGLLGSPPGERRERSLWAAVAHNKPALAKEGEHLCGPCALKRSWPRLFVRQTTEAVPELERLDRFVLSTHAVAMASSIWRWLDLQTKNRPVPVEHAVDRLRAQERLRARLARGEDLKPAALPRRLHARLREKGADVEFFKRLPALADAARGDHEAAEVAADLQAFLGQKPETYYALVLLDGDRLGAWLAGDAGQQKMGRRFHETTLKALRREGKFAEYLAAERPASPARHQAISTALNGFALGLARVVVEDLFLGKLIYAGGDDLLAMVAVLDLPGLMLALRCTYSGVLPAGVKPEDLWARLTGESQDRMRLRNGFALLTDGKQKRLLRLMGGDATASVGAVVTHHQAPLSRVLADLRAAEKRAKDQGKRDAFCITLDKRAGGTSHLVGKWKLEAGWGGDLGLLLDLREAIAHHVSRRAVYLLAESLRDVPSEADALAATLRYRFGRQARDEAADLSALAGRLAASATGRPADGDWPEWPGPNRWVRDLLLTAEFLAREGRVGVDNHEGGE